MSLELARSTSPPLLGYPLEDPLVRYQATRQLTEALAEPLSPEDQTVQSMPDVSPTKWHRAHTTWFFETFLLQAARPGHRPYHPAFAYLFNSYYESVGDRFPRARRGLVSRPGVAEIAAYRRAVDVAMAELLAEPITEDLSFLLELGLQHEQQHQELLLMDAKHVLSQSPLDPVYAPRPAPGPAVDAGDPEDNRAGAHQPGAHQPGAHQPEWWVHPGGLVEVGDSGQGFCFDNETPRHPVYLQPFELAGQLVTCGEWLAFMEDGGYRRPELWLSEGWVTCQAEGWVAPLYWRAEPEGWSIFTLAGRQELDPSEPVCHVSYFEADAYARWAGARLPTEEEWEVLACQQAPADPAVAAQGFLDWRGPAAGAPHPRARRQPTLTGEVWVWTSSAYLPYPGFRPWAGGIGEYNGKFMVNQQVLRGGCCATPAGHHRPTYRNFYPPAARWPFTGVRLARDERNVRPGRRRPRAPRPGTGR